MATFLSAVLLAATLPVMPPAPIGEAFPGNSKSVGAIIFEFSGYGGTKSTARAKVTLDSARAWCAAWEPGTAAKENACAKDMFEGNSDRIDEASANCATGDLWTYGEHYRFDGADKKSEFFAGYVAMIDVATGKRVAMNNAAGGPLLGAIWLTLCPYGEPYERRPVDVTFRPREDESLIGMHMGHNGSTMFFHQMNHVITYANPKASIAGTVRPDAVLFRGWHVPNEWIRGVAFTFKKGCAPAPYLVDGYDNGGLTLTLSGKAPVRDGCSVIGYKAGGVNSKLVFDLPGD